jgi:restriction system protein
MTIVKAIESVMREAGKPLSANEAYELIAAKNLYEFKAKNPQSVVASTIRKHCSGIDRKNAPSKKHFALTEKGLYQLL